MALRSEDLVYRHDARVVEFPLHVVAARARRRARLVMMRRRIVSLSVVVLIAAGVLAGGGIGHSQVASAPGAPRSVTLAPGQTLWDLARRHAPQRIDPRVYIEAVLALNGLEAPPQAGTRLRLPR
jgi:hypothetical protein